MNSILELTRQLYKCKQAEAEIKQNRMALEDQLARELQVPEQWEGSKTIGVEQGDERYKVKITRKMNTVIDGKLTSFAAEKGLTDYLGVVFRWKPELNKKEWDGANENVRAAFSEVVIQKPGKPSFLVTLSDSNKEEN